MADPCYRASTARGYDAIAEATCSSCVANANVDAAAAERERYDITKELGGIDATRTVAEGLLRYGGAPAAERLTDVLVGIGRLRVRAELVEADFKAEAISVVMKEVAARLGRISGKVKTALAWVGERAV